MRIIDLSQPLFDNCPNCPVHPPVRIEVTGSHAKDGPQGWHMEQLSFASHTGSHVDAPLHKLRGAKSLDDLPLESWQGKALILDFRGISPQARIDARMLDEKLLGLQSLRDNFVLLATGWGDKRAKTREWLYDAPSLAPDGAQWLVDHHARGVGIDHFSIGDAEIHAILLAKPVLIVEELHFPPESFSLKGETEFWALPINLQRHSGAPCRPVLVIRGEA